jgi:transitional endoplasmic reticulum ATPase
MLPTRHRLPDMQQAKTSPSSHGESIKTFFDHCGAQRVNTNVVMARSLQQQYPSLELVMVFEGSCDLFAYATSTGKASFEPITDEPADKSVPHSLLWTNYRPAHTRTGKGQLMKELIIGKFHYQWEGNDFIIYYADGRDGQDPYPKLQIFYILTPDKAKAEALIEAAGQWKSELHEEVWVFDSGYWQKSAALFDSIRNASWDNVILDSAMKKALIDDHTTFFKSKERYTKLKVPWKRGIILYGPPGNGKTISIKAMMNLLYNLPDSIPTLYVRSLKSFAGSEDSIKQIFSKARAMSPCYLILEDLDSIITDDIRSYFLNEVDGLTSNDGIFMVGSTNHLDRLDEGVAKRPSRFDRKYQFKDPIKPERVAYCHFWQSKLEDNKDIDFPDILCDAIAGITDKFSFAYMQEAFVATLLTIARKEDEDDSAGSVAEHDWVKVKPRQEKDLDKYVLWREIKVQVQALREGIKGESE